MKIAVISGKGGTGKTFVATNMARAIQDLNDKVWYVDADVEEPNGHLFLNPEIILTEKVQVSVPVINAEYCTQCGVCVNFCRFHALLMTPGGVVTFPNLCHGCGGCMMFCNEHAIMKQGREIGIVQQGKSGGLNFLHGKLRIGEAQPVPVIRALKRHIKNEDDIYIIDGPPGTSCSVVEILRNSDVCLLVTEPTPFGLHDLSLAVDTVKKMGVPACVIINRCDIGDRGVYDFCEAERLPVVMEIPFRREYAEAYSVGTLVVDRFEGLTEKFIGVFERVSGFSRAECEADGGENK